MPVLAQERTVLPDDLFVGSSAIDDRAWWLAHTRPRQEKALARDLAAAGVSFYLPCSQHRIRVRGRVAIASIPLFSGYAFLRLADAERLRVLQGRRVAHLALVRDQVRLWNDLRNVHRLLELGQPVSPADDLAAGTNIVVRTGPLAGMTGTVVRSAGGCKFVVHVDLIQRGIAVVVDAETLGRLQ